MNKLSVLAVVLVSSIVMAGCGSSSSNSSPSPGGASTGAPTATTTSASPSTTTGAASSPGALSAEAQSAATGDIPDNQVFLTFHDRAAGYSISYPEGWAQTGSGSDVSFRDKNNIVHIAIGPGSQPTAATASAGLARERARTPSLRAGKPQSMVLKAGKAIKVTYTTESTPNPVTGKRVKLIVDRYVLPGRGGRVATVELGTARGVDNVDAYRMMIQSFTWK